MMSLTEPRVHMGQITGAEARALYAQNPVILLPMGSHEDQGPHAPMGDYLLAEKIAELAAVRAVFGDELPVLTSNKWLIGHTLGASAALSLAFAIDLLHGEPAPRYPYPVPFAQRDGAGPVQIGRAHV